MDWDELTSNIIGAAIEVHRELGPGLLEKVYEECLAFELDARGLSYQRQVPVPVCYRGRQLNVGYRLDLVVEHRVILELKAVEAFLPVHAAQLLTYLRLSDLRVGLLINFNKPVLRDGIKRLVNNF